MKKSEMIINKLAEKYGEAWAYMLNDDRVCDKIHFLRYCEDDLQNERICKDLEEEIVEAADRVLCPANIKVGDGVSVCLYSDRSAATVIKVTKATVTVRHDRAILDPNFKPEFIAGGFAGHCINQDEQKYTYEPDENGSVETFRWSKKFNQYGTPGNPRLIKGRYEFYDYNF